MEKTLQYEVAPEDRVPLTRKALYSVGAVADPLVVGTVGTFTMLFYNGVLGVPGKWIGWILLVPRIWDAITDPWIGKMSDNCTSPLGRRRPYFLAGGIVMAISYALLWSPPPSLESDFALTTYFAIMGVIFFTGYTAFVIPYGALAIEMTPDYKERTSLMAVRKVFHGGGEMLISTMPWLAATLPVLLMNKENTRYGYAMTGILFGVVALVVTLISFKGTREREGAELASQMPFWDSMKCTWKNRVFIRLTAAVFALVLAIMTLASFVGYLFMFYLERPGLFAISGMYGGALGILVAPLWGHVSNRIGKPRAIFFAQGIIALACLSTWVCFNKDFPYLAFLYFTLYATGWSGLLVIASAIMADVIDLDELLTGERREGSYSGVFGFIFKMGVAATGPVIGYAVDWTGFNADLEVQEPLTFLKMRLIMLIASVVFAALGMVCLWRFPLTPERAMEIRRQLEERRGKRGAMA